MSSESPEQRSLTFELFQLSSRRDDPEPDVGPAASAVATEMNRTKDRLDDASGIRGLHLTASSKHVIIGFINSCDASGIRGLHLTASSKHVIIGFINSCDAKV